MNGLLHLEPDFSEFVEVDPTGRYGRVSNNSLSLLFLGVSNSVISAWNLILNWFLFWLQYNEILGKGASKTVYVLKALIFFTI